MEVSEVSCLRLEVNGADTEVSKRRIGDHTHITWRGFRSANAVEMAVYTVHHYRLPQASEGFVGGSTDSNFGAYLTVHQGDVAWRKRFLLYDIWNDVGRVLYSIDEMTWREIQVEWCVTAFRSRRGC